MVRTGRCSEVRPYRQTCLQFFELNNVVKDSIPIVGGDHVHASVLTLDDRGIRILPGLLFKIDPVGPSCSVVI
jgi:hypothetical protein